MGKTEQIADELKRYRGRKIEVGHLEQKLAEAQRLLELKSQQITGLASSMNLLETLEVLDSDIRPEIIHVSDSDEQLKFAIYCLCLQGFPGIGILVTGANLEGGNVDSQEVAGEDAGENSDDFVSISKESTISFRFAEGLWSKKFALLQEVKADDEVRIFTCLQDRGISRILFIDSNKHVSVALFSDVLNEVYSNFISLDEAFESLFPWMRIAAEKK